MKTIDLKAVIEAKSLDIEILAKQLYPTNQYPRLALNRVMAGKAELDASQISKLSSLSGIPIGELFTNGNWSTQSTDGLHIFSNENYRAELDTKTWITKVFHNNSMIHESVIHGKDTPLSEYLIALNNVILNIN